MKLQFCKACLVSDVKMYGLNSSEKIPMSETFQLMQIPILNHEEYVCFLCVRLLKKFQEFKLKCQRAHDIQSRLMLDNVKLTQQIINNIDRKSNGLSYNFIFTSITDSYDVKNDKDFDEVNISYVKTEEEYDDNEDLNIKDEEQRSSDNNVYSDESNPVDDRFSSDNNSDTDKVSSKKKRKTLHKKPKTKSREIKSYTKSVVKHEDEEVDNRSLSNELNDAEDCISSENNLDTNKISSKNKRKTSYREPMTKRRKIKSETNSVVKHQDEDADDRFPSDDEPLSSKVAKNKKKKNTSNINYMKRFNASFFEDYATVVFLTPEEAEKEVLLRKETNNYKNSQFKCELCFRGYESKIAFANHMKKHSVEYGEHECELCHLRFPQQGFLCKHRLACHKRKFYCKICPYICFCTHQAKTHVSLHKGKKYPCKECSIIFSMPNSLAMHKRLKHMTECVCELCGSTFATTKGLSFHNLKIHRQDKNSKQGPKCEDCGIHFATEMAWKRHFVLSSKHIVCNGCKYCGETFDTPNQLKIHMRASHSRKHFKKNGRFPVACSICNKSLVTLSVYKSHMMSEHPSSEMATKIIAEDQELPKFVCEVCGRMFKQQCLLTYHQRKHTGERPYACPECGKAFLLAGALAAHRAVHAPPPRRRAHACAVCARAFTGKSALNKHMKVHLGIRPHKCPICDKSFINKCDVKLHIKYVHHKVPWPKRDRSKRNTTEKAAPFE